MPPRLSRPPDPSDPEYQRLERHINFALHVGIFTASNSFIWFVRSVNYANWQWSLWMASLWLVCLMGHGIWMFARDQKGEINHE